jgi:ribosome-binding protein aMBF1 (putative translation factor)
MTKQNSNANFDISEIQPLSMKPSSRPSPDLPRVQPVTTLRDIGEQIRAARRRQGLRIDDAASLCGVSVDLMSRLENGKGSVGTDKVLLVMAALGMELFVAPKGHSGLRALLHQEMTDG